MSVVFDCQLLLRQTQTEGKKKVCVSVFERGGGAVREPERDFQERARG